MNYDTLSEAVTDLQKRGYIEDHNLQSDCIECKSLDYKMYIDQFEIDEMHRFEGASNPDDSSILFAISSDSFKLKGLLVDAYGAYADPLNIEMIQKLKYKALS
ncbi:phosphoribosylpyrophosphate synthetase [uncultured Croceitalea sp.]|uniref:phosphoribosylpyrophosphate synthetase n=1 Tax=uncultured Croceitalea sp. TaxID=1798908 RepID=UPI003305CF84